MFLSASVPEPGREERYRRAGIRRVPHAPLEIEEAVVSLARAVFAAGGGLVFGGHPSIAPLVSLVAAEYVRPRAAERQRSAERAAEAAPLVTIYQLDVYRDLSPQATRLMAELGHARIVEEPVVTSERRADPRLGSVAFPESLSHMRARMVRESQPRAMVCIGGMEGVEYEADVFAKIMPRRPIFALATTGGAAALLDGRNGLNVRFIDREVLKQLDVESQGPGAEAAGDGPRAPSDELLVPYPLIMQVLVAELLGDRPTANGRQGGRVT